MGSEKLHKHFSKKLFGIKSSRLQKARHLILSHSTPRKMLNAFNTFCESKMRPAIAKAMPIFAQIECNNICTLKCPTCPTGLGVNPDKSGSMTLETYKKCIDELKGSVFYILLFGFGEPFIHKDIFEMIEYARDNNIGVVLSTNLNNFNNADAERLIKSGATLLIVSFDGTTQDVYSKYRKNGVLSKVISSIKAITEKKKELKSSLPLVHLQYIMMEHNKHQIPQALKMKDELGADDIYFEDVGPCHEIKTSTKKHPIEIEPIRRRLMFCKRLWQSTYISWYGAVRPCCLTFDGEFGNINSRPFAEIWNSEGYQKSRQLLSSADLGNEPFHSPCFRCHLLLEHAKPVENFDKILRESLQG